MNARVVPFPTAADSKPLSLEWRVPIFVAAAVASWVAVFAIVYALAWCAARGWTDGKRSAWAAEWVDGMDDLEVPAE